MKTRLPSPCVQRITRPQIVRFDILIANACRIVDLNRRARHSTIAIGLRDDRACLDRIALRHALIVDNAANARHVDRPIASLAL